MRIFQSNIIKVAQLLLLPRLRSLSMTALLRTCAVPIERVRKELLRKRQDVDYWWGISPQRCYLEKALNDTFDNEQRRIYLENNQGVDAILLHTAAAQKPIIIKKDNALVIHTKANYGGTSVDFSVKLNGVKLNASEYQHLRYIVSHKCLPDKHFKIQTR